MGREQKAEMGTTQKIPDKGHHAIYWLDFAAQCFLAAVFQSFC